MIYIIGAGPIGCYAAYLLAKKRNVRIFEEHSSIGQPVQCTGIVTHDILKFIPEKSGFIINSIGKTKIFAPNKKYVEVNFKNPDIILDREKFDNYFYQKAKSRGVNIRFHLSHRLTKISERSLVFVKKNPDGKEKTISYPLKKGDIVIGADGPMSKVYEIINPKIKRKYFLGWQYRLKNKPENLVEFYPTKKSFAWVVPESKDTVRAGIYGPKIKRDDFIKFISERFPDYKKNLLESQGGLIPIHNPKIKVYRKIKNSLRDLRFFVIGDAGLFVKATSGGGIIPGLKSAEVLKQCISKNKDFNFEIKKSVNKELWLHLMAYKVFRKMSPNEWNNLVNEMNSKEAKDILGKINRDNFRQLAFSLIWKKPSLLRYVFKLF